MKRAREPADPADGWRVLVYRLWPRGPRKEALALDEWARDLAPEDSLRRWCGHDPVRWPTFASAYRDALRHTPASQRWLKETARRARAGTVTLVFDARDAEHGNAAVLRDVLERAVARAQRPPVRTRVPAQRRPPVSGAAPLTDPAVPAAERGNRPARSAGRP